jgi:hypothetical protein
LKFLSRSLGLLLVAAGFIGLVIDGTRSIVNHAIWFAPLGGVVNFLVPGGVSGLQAQVAVPSYPWLWDPIFTNLLQVPASLAGFLLGALLLWLGQKPLEPIGYMAGR